MSIIYRINQIKNNICCKNVYTVECLEYHIKHASFKYLVTLSFNDPLTTFAIAALWYHPCSLYDTHVISNVHRTWFKVVRLYQQGKAEKTIPLLLINIERLPEGNQEGACHLFMVDEKELFTINNSLMVTIIVFSVNSLELNRNEYKMG